MIHFKSNINMPRLSTQASYCNYNAGVDNKLGTTRQKIISDRLNSEAKKHVN